MCNEYGIDLEGLDALSVAVSELDFICVLPAQKALVERCHAILVRTLGADVHLVYGEDDAESAGLWCGLDDRPRRGLGRDGQVSVPLKVLHRLMLTGGLLSVLERQTMDLDDGFDEARASTLDAWEMAYGEMLGALARSGRR